MNSFTWKRSDDARKYKRRGSKYTRPIIPPAPARIVPEVSQEKERKMASGTFKERLSSLSASFSTENSLDERVALIRNIIIQTAEKYGLTTAAIISPRRDAESRLPRYEIMWRAYRELGMSSPEIGIVLRRDHTTVMYGIRQYEAHLEKISEKDE